MVTITLVTTSYCYYLVDDVLLIFSKEKYWPKTIVDVADYKREFTQNGVIKKKTSSEW